MGIYIGIDSILFSNNLPTTKAATDQLLIMLYILRVYLSYLSIIIIYILYLSVALIYLYIL